MRLFARKPVAHRVRVFDTRPFPRDPTPFEPYFIAVCDCDWLGPVRETSDEAFEDAYGHTDDVDRELKRPAG